MSRPRRVFGYARVSSAEQALGSSLEDQKNSIAAYAKDRGLSVTRFYVEAESAVHEKIERREQIQSLMRDAREGDLVLVDKLDRWSRDPAFTHTSIRDLLKLGASFYSVSERCDPSTSEGDTMLGFRVLFAKEEHKRIRERTVGTRRLLRDRGYYVEGETPYGYKRAHPKGYKGLDKNILVFVEKEAEEVREVFRLYVGGRSMNQIGRHMSIPLWKVKRLLTQRVYTGELQATNGEWIKGHHPALIDIATFAKVTELRVKKRLGGARPRGAPAETDDWILRDVATCALCGARMGAAYAGPKNARRYYYRCVRRCEKVRSDIRVRFIRRDVVEAQGAELVVARLIDLREELAHAPERRSSPRINFEEKRAKLARKRERFLEAFAGDIMTAAELRASLTKLDVERLKIDAEEASNSPQGIDDPTVRRETLRDIKTLERAWKRVNGRGRRTIVNALALEMRIRVDVSPVPRWRPIEDMTFEGL